MREILFRGIDEGTNEWVYGYYYEKPDYYCGDKRYYIFDDKTISKYNVLHETVGQYTGLTDKNGKKIFEGDIVESTSALVDLYGRKSGKETTRFYEVVVTADNSSFTYGTREIGETYISRPIYKENSQRFYSVIGNIHDNPELLEVVRK